MHSTRLNCNQLQLTALNYNQLHLLTINSTQLELIALNYNLLHSTTLNCTQIIYMHSNAIKSIDDLKTLKVHSTSLVRFFSFPKGNVPNPLKCELSPYSILKDKWPQWGWLPIAECWTTPMELTLLFVSEKRIEWHWIQTF